MELDNIKVVKKTKTVKKIVKQDDDPELEDDMIINAIPKKAKKKKVEKS